MRFSLPAGILEFKGKFPYFLRKTEDLQMKMKLAAALFCAGMLAVAPVSSEAATLPGGVLSKA